MLKNAQKDFIQRHIGPSVQEQSIMLKELGYENLDELIKDTVPEKILLKDDLEIGDPNSEYKALRKLKNISKKNKVYSSFIGMGYYGTYTPYVILRNILENPGWYTSYTPYQPEVAQGRLEMLMNFQQMIIDFTGMDIANASLLDEGTAAAEAMGVTSARLEELGIVDQTIMEPLGGAHRNMKEMASSLKENLSEQLARLGSMDIDDLLDRRYRRLMSHGAIHN